jgi:hypothetical protein
MLIMFFKNLNLILMKKFFATFLLIAAFALLTNDQVYSQDFSPGDLVVNANLETGGGTTLIGTIDYGVAQNISVGGGLGLTFFSGSSSARLLGRGLYHFGSVADVANLDLYGGGELGIGLSSGGTSFALLPGARYWFNDSLAGNIELPIYLSGGGLEFRLGVSFRLN